MKSFEQYIKGSRPVVVEFYAMWSEACKLMDAELQEVRERVHERAIVIKIDVEEYSERIEQYYIHSIPTVIIFMDGQSIWRKNGFAPAYEILDHLSTIMT